MPKKRLILDENKRFKQLRRALKLSQVSMGETLGVVQSTIFRWESGVQAIPATIVKKLHKIFKMSLEWYYNGHGPMFTVPDKSSLVKDIAKINTMIELLEQRVDGMDKLLRELYGDYYAGKKVSSNDAK